MIRSFEKIASSARYPVTAFLELTYSCNWNCRHCYAVGDVPDPLTIPEWKKLINEFESISAIVLTFTGGEPMMHPGFFEIASHARQKGFAIKVFSNGSLLSSDNINEFADLKPLRVDMSIHGRDEKTHDYFTCFQGSFKKVMESIELLKTAGIKVLLKCTVTKLNQEQLLDIKKLAMEIGVNIAFDTVLQAANNGDDSALEYAVTDDFRERFWSEEFDLITGGGGRKPTDWSEVRNVCGACRKSVTVDPCGNVLPCSQWRKVLGNVKQLPLKKILDESPELLEVLKTTSSLVEKVKNLPFGEFCNICPGASFNQTGSPGNLTDQAVKNAVARMNTSKGIQERKIKFSKTP